jgi:replicative DNA helicase
MAFEKNNSQKNESLMAIDRLPPQSIEAEQSVLGAMLLDKEAVVVGEDVLRREDFYREADAVIFEAILRLAHAGREADILTVAEELRKMGKLDDVGGVLYINELPEHCTTPKSIGYHAEIVSSKSKLRHLIEAANVIAASAYAGQDDVQDIVDDAERRILEVAKDQRQSDFIPIGEAIQSELTSISEKYRNNSGITGLPSGFQDLDSLTSGFQKGDFIIMAARPSMGKTAFVLNIAKNVSLGLHKSVAFFSLEMSREQLVQRLLCSTALIDSQKLRTGKLTTQKEWESLTNAASVLLDAPLYIDDTPGISVGEIRSKARRLKAEKGLDIIMIDYLQLMQSRGSRNSDNRQQEISEISRSLKGLARELNVPVISLSQLSRSVEARQDHRPLLSDLRESGSLEQDADMVGFLYREAYYKREEEMDESQKNLTEVILAKNRNGPIGVVNLFFAGQFTLFYDLSNREDPPKGVESM